MRPAKSRHLFWLFCKTSQFITFIILVCSAFIFVDTADAAYNIRDDATGGNCSSIGIWNWNTKTCTLIMDLADSILINNDGITLDGANHQISGNNVGFGITIDYWKNIIVKNLKIKNFAYGIYISDSENNLVTGNIISDNSDTGIVLLNSHGNLITENEISSNQVSGIEIWYVYAMSENKVYHNNFLNKGYQIYAMFDEGDFFYQAPPIGGNYWSNYDEPTEGCVDLNNDNICDSPYIFSDGQDNLPWIRQDAWLRIQLPQTGQTTCYDSAGAVIPCAGTGQDGEIQAGVPWPSPRFADNGDGTVTDNLTGLMWAKDGNAPGPAACAPATTKTWQGALNYVTCLNTNAYLGYADWRLPNVNELESLTNAEQALPASWLNTQGFNNVQSNFYWSSTTYAYITWTAYLVNVSDGRDGAMNKFDYYVVWPVRSGQSGIIQLPRTGQTTSYSAGDDGDFQRGVVWPSPRFIDHGNGTGTDNLTGLMWTKDANLMAIKDPGFDTDDILGEGRVTWQRALDYVAKLNTEAYLGYSDWRLPNRKELQSLIDRSLYSPFLPAGHPFINVEFAYWSSTSYAYDSSFAWHVGIALTDVGPSNKTGLFEPLGVYYYVWPVRGGLVGGGTTLIDTDNDGYPDNQDCDYNNPNIYPGAPETCNDKDDNCNNQIDEGCIINQPPVLNLIGNKSVNEGSLLNFTVSGSDPDGDLLTYSATNLPAGANFNPVTQTFSWTPDYTQAGPYNVTFTVSDGSLTDSEIVAITVNDICNPDVIEIPFDRIDQDCDGKDVTEFWAEIQNTSNGVLNLRKTCGSVGKPNDDIQKELPNSWVLKVISDKNSCNNNDSFQWVKIKDTTDETIGWMVAAKLDIDGNIVTEYLTSYKSSDQDQKLGQKAAQVNSTTETIIKAVNDYHNNTDTTYSLYSSNDFDNNISIFKEIGFPQELILAIAAQESGGIDFDNEWVSRDFGHGIMQVTFKPASYDIEYLQIVLKNEPSYQKDGGIIEIYPEGLITGEFGSATEQAVIRFQEKYADEILKPAGLSQGTGVVGKNTRIKLNSLLSNNYYAGIHPNFTFERNLEKGMKNTKGNWDNRGIGSKVKIPLSSNLDNPEDKNYYLNSYGKPNNLGKREYVKNNYYNQTFKYYTNTSQGIYSNIKDGVRVLQNKYKPKCPNANKTLDGIVDGETISLDYTCMDIEHILMVWGYNGFATDEQDNYTGNYLRDVAHKLNNPNPCIHCHSQGNEIYTINNPNPPHYPPSNLNTYFAETIKDSNKEKIDILYKKFHLANDYKKAIKLFSPANLSIIDSEGRMTGMVNGGIKEEISNSAYYDDDKSIILLFPENTYSYQVVGTEEGTYGLFIDSTDNGTSITFTASDIPISPKEIHTYTVNWTALANNEKGVTLNIDYEGDGVADRTVTAGNELSDITPPQIIGPDLNREYLFNSQVQMQFSATDDRSGVASITAILNGIQVANGQTVILNKPGINKLEIIATDNAGNTNKLIKTFNVVYNFGGFLPPIKNDSSGVYKQGRTLPVKFQLTDVNNNYIATATPYLYIAKISNGIAGSDEIPLSTSSADVDNKFRYDHDANQYIYNLSTNSMTAGTWQLKVALDDGKSYTVLISIKN